MGEQIDARLCLLVEDQAATRAWLTEAIEQAFDPVTVVEQMTVKGALQWLHAPERQSAAPWLAIVDLGLPDGRGIEIVRAVHEAMPATQCIVATIYGDDAHLIEAITAGAQGYILKEENRDQIVATLKRIERGEPPLSPSIALRILALFRAPPAPSANAAGLSARETETLALIARGLTVAEAAAKLGLTTNTVAGYVKLIYQKLGISSRAEATREAVRRGLV
ncbi:response regulator [Novosphingobium sp. JCM 18896]|uniref:response regulator n=1 Tax=Novosphingobium sp. JCM 18896 TaxID=2989731 RepID=UPI002222BC05|nr:response regulator transcription factor [Novosphingobium sp. JCM 18896]MCW1430185.1 response regulator transcription factor [Novosphingobium sp. JCM 18896]